MRRLILLIGVLLVGLLGTPVPAALGESEASASGAIKVNNNDGSDPDVANQPNPGECGATVIGTGFAPNLSGSLTVAPQPASATRPTRTWQVTTDADGEFVVPGISLIDGQYKATALGKHKVFRILECERTDPPGPDECSDGFVWNPVTERCEPVDCPAGQRLVNGECVPDDGCPPGHSLVNGECVEDEDDEGCPDGFVSENGECVEPPCPEGQSRVDGVCVDDGTDVLPIVVERGIDRIAGRTRIETAIAVSNRLFEPGAAGAVVLARSDLYPDALTGTPLAVATDAPLLLTPPAYLHGGTQAEIQRVLPAGGTVYLLGGETALSAAVADAVRDLGYEVTRYGGRDRFATATIIADEGLGNPETIFIANGTDFPDALTAGAVAGFLGGSVILTAGDLLPPVSAGYLSGLDEPAPVSVGGPATRAYPDALLLRGPTRFETAVAVAEYFFDQPEVVGIATGEVFADALTGGTMVARAGGPMLLSAQAFLPGSVGDYLSSLTDLQTAILFGGPSALSPEVEEAVKARLAE